MRNVLHLFLATCGVTLWSGDKTGEERELVWAKRTERRDDVCVSTVCKQRRDEVLYRNLYYTALATTASILD